MEKLKSMPKTYTQEKESHEFNGLDLTPEQGKRVQKMF